MDLMTAPSFLAQAVRVDEVLQAALERLVARHRLIGEVRGLGAMRAIELVRDPVTKEPAVEETARVIRECYDRGLLILKAGLLDNVIRLLPPLTISDTDLEAGLSILDQALGVVAA
jgi:4-aminobutyrate aminotransferase/(S)-3-amino-2-methylpropionate transaminase